VCTQASGPSNSKKNNRSLHYLIPIPLLRGLKEGKIAEKSVLFAGTGRKYSKKN